MRRSDRSKYSLLRNLQRMDTPASRVVAIGGCLPDRVVDNEEVAGMVKGPEAIRARLPRLIQRATGVLSRRQSRKGTSPSDLAVLAAQQALDESGVSLAEIDTLIFASTDMDTLEPATAHIVQAKLGLKRINAFDVSNACNSFLQAMNVANSLIATGGARRILITCGEIGSYVANKEVSSKEDLRFKMGGLTLGDAGAAMILEKSDGRSGLLEANLVSMGEYWPLCHVPETTDWRQRDNGSIHGWFYLDMPELAKLVRRTTLEYFKEYRRYRKEVFREDNFLDHLVKIIPHQISTVLIDEMAKAENCDPRKLCVTVQEWGNIASASIPLTLRRAMQDDDLRFGCGKEVLLYGAASGYSLGHLRIRL